MGGLDTDPCTYNLPCGTFQGAHNKTNPGGIVSAKVSGDYGPVNITKSITIDGAGVAAYINVAAGNAISLSPGTINDVVILRNLILNGLGTAARGISHTNDATLIVEKVRIANFGIGYFAQGSLTNNRQKAEISYTTFDGNSTGAEIRDNTEVALSNCVITGTLSRGGTPFGINVQPVGNTAALVKVEFCEISYTHSAIRATGSDIPGRGTPFLYLRSNHIFRNSVAVNVTLNVLVFSDGLNRITANTQNIPTTPTLGIIPMESF